MMSCFLVMTDSRSLDSKLREGIERLKMSPIEAQIAAFLVSGLTDKRIAKAVGMSTKTVQTYRRRIFAKTGVTSIVDLVMLIAAR